MNVAPGAKRGVFALLLTLAAVACALPALAQSDGTATKGRSWQNLSSQEQQALLPLKGDWAQLEPARQKKWLEVAARVGSLPAEERLRIQERMAQWAAMTPVQRASARLQFQEARQLSPGDRQAMWEAYQALPDEERRELAQRAKPGATPATAAPRADLAASSVGVKNNLVKLQSPSVRAVSSSIVQAKPGATTTTITTRPSPPAHHHAGLPKIAATPEFVDPATLLPKRGAQAAATVDTAPPVSNEPEKAQ